MTEIGLDQRKVGDAVAAAKGNGGSFSAWEFTSAEKALMLNAQVLSFVANAPVDRASAFPIKEDELRGLLSDLLQRDFIRLLKESGLSQFSKTRPMHVGKQSVTGGKTAFNVELVDFSVKVLEGLREFRAKVNMRLGENPGNMHLYELQYDLSLLSEAAECAIKALQEGAFWKSNDPIKPLFIPLVELQ